MNQAHSFFQWDPNEQPEPAVRQPLDGDPELTELVHPGDYIRSSYDTEGLVVDMYPMKYHVAGRTVEAHSIRFWSRRKLEQLAVSEHIRLADFSTYNEVVVHGGKLCQLFEANSHTYEIVPVPDDVVITERAWAFLRQRSSPQQKSMF